MLLYKGALRRAPGGKNGLGRDRKRERAMQMEQEHRTAVYDRALGLEAYRLEGVVQPFPAHFHEYYVIGLMEGGRRHMSCRGREYALAPGDIVLFQPGDVHACAPLGAEPLDYRGINITCEVMGKLSGEAEGKGALPRFFKNVVRDEEAARCLHRLHQMLMKGESGPEREERLLPALELVLGRCVKTGEGEESPFCRQEVERACAFMEQHCAERVSLEQISRAAELSRSALLRAFTREKGVTPYLYLQNIRIREAKKLLRQGLPPVEAALRTGFSDQSHFTRDFRRFIGLSPGTYRRMFQGKKKEDAAGRPAPFFRGGAAGCPQKGTDQDGR